MAVVLPFHLLSLEAVISKLFYSPVIHPLISISICFHVFSASFFGGETVIKDLYKYVAIEVSFDLKIFQVVFYPLCPPLSPPLKPTARGQESGQEQERKLEKRKKILDQDPIGGYLLYFVVMSL